MFRSIVDLLKTSIIRSLCFMAALTRFSVIGPLIMGPIDDPINKVSLNMAGSTCIEISAQTINRLFDYLVGMTLFDSLIHYSNNH